MDLFHIKFVGTILGLAFLMNAIYGLYSRKVYGKSGTKIAGGWIYLASQPGYYWQYVFLSFFVSAVLLFSCASLL